MSRKNLCTKLTFTTSKNSLPAAHSICLAELIFNIINQHRGLIMLRIKNHYIWHRGGWWLMCGPLFKQFFRLTAFRSKWNFTKNLSVSPRLPAVVCPSAISNNFNIRTQENQCQIQNNQPVSHYQVSIPTPVTSCQPNLARAARSNSAAIPKYHVLPLVVVTSI